MGTRQGEPRFVATIGTDKRVLLSLEAAAELLPPAFEAVGPKAFDATMLQVRIQNPLGVFASLPVKYNTACRDGGSLGPSDLCNCLKGLESLSKAERATFYSLFKVPTAAARHFDKLHAAPEPAQEASTKKRRKLASQKASQTDSRSDVEATPVTSAKQKSVSTAVRGTDM